jgi:hypothetical protein
MSTNIVKRRQSPSFFRREDDGSVRLRIRFEEDLASLIEEAAGKTPLLVWIYRTLETTARRQVDAARRSRPRVDPPLDE